MRIERIQESFIHDIKNGGWCVSFRGKTADHNRYSKHLIVALMEALKVWIKDRRLARKYNFK